MERKMIALVLVALALAGVAASQQPATPPVPSTAPESVMPTTSEPGHYLGVASCGNSGCHGSTLALQESRVLQNEYYTWLNSDRHAKAYNVLFNDRSARIVRNMHLRRKANEETLCLDCHSTNVPKSLVAGHVDPEDGVQCEACHGPAGGWRAEHTEAGWTHEQSVARGMIDLRHLPTRASSCLACHLGGRNKEVDHELIASGHPVLAFELDNYTETMPPHWKRNADDRGRDTHGVRAFAIGQAVAFRESLDNLARHARGDQWPEFSDLSCTTCHHRLDEGAARQQRGWPGRAGLPAWSPQHWAVLRVLIARAAPTVRTQLDDTVQMLAPRVSRMNDPKGVSTAAGEARRLIDDVVPQLDALPWRDNDVRTLMRQLTSDDDSNLRADVYTAEQTALALQSLASALTRSNPRLLKSPMNAAVDALFAELQNRDNYDPARFAQKLAALRRTL
jgi:Cytochrome c554 and c-prime